MTERRRRFLRRAGTGLTLLGGCGADPGAPSADDSAIGRDSSSAAGSSSATDSPPATDSSTPTETATSTPSPLADVDTSETVGVSHVGGTYDFTDEDYLNEGGARLRDLGTGVVKTYLHRAHEKYPFDSDWPDGFETMRETVEHPHYREFLKRGFRTHILTAYSHVAGEHGAYFTDGVSDERAAAEREEFRDLTEHLLTEYRGTGKTFVLQHWEGDWHLLEGYDTAVEPSSTAIDGMIRWLTARQSGVESARESVDSDVSVLHATEVNRVRSAMTGDASRMVTDVLPEVTVDLVSYSAWDLAGALSSRFRPSLVGETLTFVEDKSNGPTAYARERLDGRRNVFIGEYGWPVVKHGEWEAKRITETITEEAVEWGVPYAVFWQLFCNERTDGGDDRPANDEVAGFHLVRPDGTETLLWDYFSELYE